MLNSLEIKRFTTSDSATAQGVELCVCDARLGQIQSRDDGVYVALLQHVAYGRRCRILHSTYFWESGWDVLRSRAWLVLLRVSAPAANRGIGVLTWM